MLRIIEELREKVWQLSYENQQLRGYKDVNALMRDAIELILKEKNPQTLFTHLFALTTQILGDHPQIMLQRRTTSTTATTVLAATVNYEHLVLSEDDKLNGLFYKPYQFFNVKHSSRWPNALEQWLPKGLSALTYPFSSPSADYVLIITATTLGQFNQHHAHTLARYAEFISAVLSLIETQRLVLERDSLLLQQARIQQSLERQEKLASIGQLAAGVAHELNNPLGFIQSNLVTLNEYIEEIAIFLQQASSAASVHALVQKYNIDFIREDMQDLIKDCLLGTEKANTIVQHLRSYAHPTNDHAEVVNVREEIDRTLAIARSTIKHKSTLSCSYATNDCHVLINKNHFSQILLNLLANATHAISHHQGEIHVSVSQEMKRCVIVVKDNGSGIDEQHLPYVFDPFFTTKQVGEGTGLGLSLSRNLALQANGTLTLEYTNANGTGFALSLPIVEEAANGDTS